MAQARAKKRHTRFTLKMDRRSELVERYTDSHYKQENTERHEDSDGGSEDSDDILELLEQDDDASAQYRAQRTQELAQELKHISHAVKTAQNESRQVGKVVDYSDEGSLMALLAQKDTSEYYLVHFYELQFEKCRVMNQRLEQLASKHLDLRIMRIQASNAPFLVAKLKIKVLPCVAIYRCGVECDRLVGFSKLGNDVDGFSLAQLERYLMDARIIRYTSNNLRLQPSIAEKQEVDDEVDEWE